MDDLAALERKIDMLAKEFSGAAGRQRLTRVAVQTKKDVDEAVRGTLGDQSMSGWRRKKPIVIKGRFDVVSDHEFLLKPNVAGPMVVLEFGRNSTRTGPTKRYSKKTGRQLRTKRWNGRTAAKHTWTKAEALAKSRTAERVDKEVVKTLNRFFKG